MCLVLTRSWAERLPEMSPRQQPASGGRWAAEPGVGLTLSVAARSCGSEQMTLQVSFPVNWASALSELQFCPALKVKKYKNIFTISILDTFKTISKIMGTAELWVFFIFLPLDYSKGLVFLMFIFRKLVIQEIVCHSCLLNHNPLRIMSLHRQHQIHGWIKHRDWFSVTNLL